MRLVVDASVAVRWFVPEELSDEAEALLDGRHDLAAPDFLLLECANVFWKKARLGELAVDDAQAALHDLATGPMLWLQTTPVVEEAYAIAGALAHPVYDCVYLAAARADDRVLVTADRRLLGRVASTPWASVVRHVGQLEDGSS